MEQQVIILVEPSFYGVSYVREAKKLNCYVVVVVSDAQNPELYGYTGLYDEMLVCDIRDASALYAVIEQRRFHHIDAIISATDYAISNTAQVAEQLGIRSLSVKTGKLVRNKDLARRCFTEHGVPSAQFAVVQTVEQALAAAKHIGYPVVLKPTNTASSQHVSFLRNDDELKSAFTKLSGFVTSYMGFKVRDEYLIEEYLDGQEFSVEIFVEEGRVVFAAMTEKVTSDLPFFVEKFHIFPSSVLQAEQHAIIDVAAQALTAIGLRNGPAHVEIKRTSKGPKIVEVNGRPGGDNITSDLIPSAYHIDIFRQTIRNVLGLNTDFTVSRPSSSAIGFLCAPQAGRLRAIHHLDLLEKEPGVVRYHLCAKVGERVKVPESSDDRLGYVIVNRPTPKEAKAKVVELIEKLQVEVDV